MATEYLADALSILGLSAALFLLKKSLIVVHPHEKALVERMGRYSRTLDSGMTIILPFIDKAFKVDMRESIIDVPPQDVITSDNAKVSVDTIIYYRIVDPFKTIYNIAMFEEGLTNIARTGLRNLIGGLSMDEVLGARERINNELRTVLDEVTERWGVRLTRVEIQDILPPQDITEAMGRQMKAERMKRAQVLEAEGFRRAEVLRAKGKSEAVKIMADGEAQRIKLVGSANKKRKRLIARGDADATKSVFKAIHEAGATPEIIRLKYFDTLEKMADGQSTKIFMPFDANRANQAFQRISRKKKP